MVATNYFTESDVPRPRTFAVVLSLIALTAGNCSCETPLGETVVRPSWRQHYLFWVIHSVSQQTGICVRWIGHDGGKKVKRHAVPRFEDRKYKLKTILEKCLEDSGYVCEYVLGGLVIIDEKFGSVKNPLRWPLRYDIELEDGNLLDVIYFLRVPGVLINVDYLVIDEGRTFSPAVPDKTYNFKKKSLKQVLDSITRDANYRWQVDRNGIINVFPGTVEDLKEYWCNRKISDLKITDATSLEAFKHLMSATGLYKGDDYYIDFRLKEFRVTGNKKLNFQFRDTTLREALNQMLYFGFPAWSAFTFVDEEGALILDRDPEPYIHFGF